MCTRSDSLWGRLVTGCASIFVLSPSPQLILSCNSSLFSIAFSFCSRHLLSRMSWPSLYQCLDPLHLYKAHTHTHTHTHTHFKHWNVHVALHTPFCLWFPLHWFPQVSADVTIYHHCSTIYIYTSWSCDDHVMHTYLRSHVHIWFDSQEWTSLQSIGSAPIERFNKQFLIFSLSTMCSYV